MFKDGVLDLNSVSKSQVFDFFKLVQNIKLKKIIPKVGPSVNPAMLLFFEPSTRTRFSFEMACKRIGLSSLVLDGPQGSSLEKGESVEDTVLNLSLLEPSLVIIRCGDAFDLRKAQASYSFPIINAGWGTVGHPTQALLDVYTLYEKFQNLEGLKLLIVGDVSHSRVAASHREIASKLGVQLAFCGPKNLVPQFPGFNNFENFETALRWADAVMMLRIQHERHSIVYTVEQFVREYGLNNIRIKNSPNLKAVMHPGPINHNVEIDNEVLQGPLSIISQQVHNGLYTRMALVSAAAGILEEDL